MNIYLDDFLDPPFFDENGNWAEDYWTTVRNATEAIRLVETGKVEFIDFDHDMGEDGTGYDVAKRIEELAAKGEIPPISYKIHSGNMLKTMCQTPPCINI